MCESNCLWLLDNFATSKLVVLVMGDILGKVTAALSAHGALVDESSSGSSVLWNWGLGFDFAVSQCSL